jgi:hypothetical protein
MVSPPRGRPGWAKKPYLCFLYTDGMPTANYFVDVAEVRFHFCVMCVGG